MNHRKLINDAWTYNANIRAEDGLQPPRGWRSLLDNLLIPVGFILVLVLFSFLMSHSAFAQTGSGRITGSVKDGSGALISGSSVSLINTATGATQKTTSNGEGVFTFPVVPVGQYELDVTADGFTPYKQTNKIKIDVNTALAIDVPLQIAQASSVVTITENTAEVRTTDTQIGQTIESKQVVDIPLNGRSYTDLLAVQAGVSPITTSGAANTSSGGGFGTVPAAGETNTGQFSIHGQRESDNAYYLNGASVQETIGQQAGIIPNLDFPLISKGGDGVPVQLQTQDRRASQGEVRTSSTLQPVTRIILEATA
jgi:hypothetical protein